MDIYYNITFTSMRPGAVYSKTIPRDHFSLRFQVFLRFSSKEMMEVYIPNVCFVNTKCKKKLKWKNHPLLTPKVTLSKYCCRIHGPKVGLAAIILNQIYFILFFCHLHVTRIKRSPFGCSGPTGIISATPECHYCSTQRKYDLTLIYTFVHLAIYGVIYISGTIH